MPTNWLPNVITATATHAKVTQIGSGDLLVDVLVVPGIFESVQLAHAYAARIETDAGSIAEARQLLEAARLVIRAVIPPGYEANPLVTDLLEDAEHLERSEPGNELYAERLRAAEADRLSGAITVNLHHSWGGAIAAPLWDDESRRPPDVAVLSAPAFSDCVSLGARIGGNLLVVPGLNRLSNFVVSHSLRTLQHSGIPEIVELAIRQPAGFSSHAVAHRSYCAVVRGRRLAPLDPSEAPRIGAAGQRVVLLQGTRDKAINGPRALAFYDRLTESCEVLTDVRLIRGDFEHWPLLERPGLLAKVLLESLLVEDDDSLLSPF